MTKLENYELESKNFLHNSSKQPKWTHSKLAIIKNFLIISLAFFLSFTGYGAILNLQSSLNNESGLGAVSVSAIFISLGLSCAFLPPFIISKLKLKWSIILSLIAYSVFIAANAYAKFYTLVPASILLGMSASVLWTSQSVYISELSHFYSEITNQCREALTGWFFGLFFTLFQISQICGSLSSSLILKQKKEELDLNSTELKETRNNSYIYCGFNDCPGSVTEVKILKTDPYTVYLMIAIYLALSLLSILVVAIFLDDIHKKEAEQSNPFEFLKKTLKFASGKFQILLIPITMTYGYALGFLSSDFTKSFVSCSIGVDKIGFVILFNAIFGSVFSSLCGYLSKLIGRISVISLGILLYMGVFVYCIFWVPNPENRFKFYLISALFGIGNAAIEPLINSLYASFFHNEKEQAFAFLKFWQSVGLALAFSISNKICTSLKIYSQLFMLTLSFIGFCVAELLKKNELEKK